MTRGLSYGDTVLLNGEGVEFNKKEYIYGEEGFHDTVLHGGKYSASTTLLDISCNAGRWGLVSELEGVRKVGHFTGALLASYLKRYLEGDYEDYEEGE